MDARGETCPVCNHPLQEIRQKLVCSNCHNICLTCCEGGEQDIDQSSQAQYNEFSNSQEDSDG